MMIQNKFYLVQIVLTSVLFFSSCKERDSLGVERGIALYELGQIDESIIEFKASIDFLSQPKFKYNKEKQKMLGQAYRNLAISCSKKEWYDVALEHAKSAFNIFPSSENKELIDLISNKTKD